MSIISYYRYLGKGKIKQITVEEVKKLKEINLTSAVITVERHMFLNNFNTAFSVRECKEILQFVQSLKDKENENKSTNNSSTP